MSRLVVENLHAGYGKKEVLRGVSLSVEPGEIVAVLGDNGAGKSTLLRAIAGRPEVIIRRGSITFKGEDITSLDPARRAELGIGYCLQGGRVFPNLSVRENLEFSARRFSRSKRSQRLRHMLELFPTLEGFFDSRGRAGLLSGGERQALAAAMVMIHHPELLLLDEPSAGLARDLVGEMLARVRRFAKSKAAAVILVEQNTNAAALVSDSSLRL